MKKYIHGFITQEGTCYKDIISWVDIEKPLIITFNQEENGYENISSIKTWDLYGSTFEKCKQIKYLYNDTTWEQLLLEEKKIVAKHFIVDKTLRDEVLTQQEQDEHNYFKIYDLLSNDVIEINDISNPFLTPKSIDYKKHIDGRLHPKYIFNQHGWLVECTYYENLEITQNQVGFTEYIYSNPVLNYQAEYNVKSDGYVGSRIVTRRWYRLDGTLDIDSKITQKFYGSMMARDEGKRRRRNLVNNLMIQTVGLFIMTSVDLEDVATAETDAIPFLKEISSGLSDYYEYGSKQDISNNNFLLKQQIIDSTYPRLDNFVPDTNNTVTIREFIISKIDI